MRKELDIKIIIWGPHKIIWGPFNPKFGNPDCSNPKLNLISVKLYLKALPQNPAHLTKTPAKKGVPFSDATCDAISGSSEPGLVIHLKFPGKFPRKRG